MQATFFPKTILFIVPSPIGRPVPINLDPVLQFLPFALPLFGFAWLAWNLFQLSVWKKVGRQSCPAAWEPADESVFTNKYKLYLAEQEEVLSKLGFQPAGTWLATVNPKFNTHATCFIHSSGHYVVEVIQAMEINAMEIVSCLLYTSPSPRDKRQSRMPSSA